MMKIETEEIEVIGGIPVRQRGVPGWLIVFVLAVTALSVWYLLSFSSTDYHGSFKPVEVTPATAQTP